MLESRVSSPEKAPRQQCSPGLCEKGGSWKEKYRQVLQGTCDWPAGSAMSLKRKNQWNTLRDGSECSLTSSKSQ